MRMSFEQFVEYKRQDLLKEYNRYLKRYNIPKSGNIVKSIIIGYGGNGGQILEVLGESTDPKFLESNYGTGYIVLRSCENDSIYLSPISNWWEEIEVIKG